MDKLLGTRLIGQAIQIERVAEQIKTTAPAAYRDDMARAKDLREAASIIRALATHPAQASEANSGLERIDGMTFMLHEDPDNFENEPVRLVMAMSHNNTVYCHPASQGDNGICRDDSATSSQETASE